MCNYGCVAEYYRSQFEDEDRAAEIAERNALEREEKKAINDLGKEDKEVSYE